MRNKNIELLRVISMFQIGILHAFGHGGILASCEFGTPKYFVLYFIEALCMASVNVFVLVSGYYLVNTKFKVSRVIRLIIQVFTYSLVSFLIVKFAMGESLSIKDIVKTLTPLSSGVYWFATAYVIMLILSPLLNFAINKMDKMQLKMTVVVLVAVFSIYPTVIPWSRAKLTDGYSFIWFIVLYFVSAYMRLYNYRIKKPGLVYLGIAILMITSRCIIGLITKHVFNAPTGEGVFYTYCTITNLIAALALFGLFIDAKEIRISKLSAPLGKAVFGAYLISDHAILRSTLWKTINLTGGGTGIWNLVAVASLASLAILVIGSVLEKLRLTCMRLTKIDDLICKFDQYSEKLSSTLEEKQNVS